MKNITTKTEKELKEYAQGCAGNATRRMYIDGSSYDEKSKTTPTEKRIIAGAIYGALLAIRNGHDVDSAIKTAEYIAVVMLNQPEQCHINTYDSVYLPIYNYI